MLNGVTSSVMSYDIDENSWRVEPSMRYPRTGHNMAAVDDRLYVFGGYNDDEEPVTAVEMFDPLCGTWTTCRAELIQADCGSIAVIDRSIYIASTQMDDEEPIDCYMYSPDEDSLTHLRTGDLKLWPILPLLLPARLTDL